MPGLDAPLLLPPMVTPLELHCGTILARRLAVHAQAVTIFDVTSDIVVQPLQIPGRFVAWRSLHPATLGAWRGRVQAEAGASRLDEACLRGVGPVLAILALLASLHVNLPLLLAAFSQSEAETIAVLDVIRHHTGKCLRGLYPPDLVLCVLVTGKQRHRCIRLVRCWGVQAEAMSIPNEAAPRLVARVVEPLLPPELAVAVVHDD
mmetsp:Transcript_54593/g.140527  ORF Transcript_54593/g.140527 Transcript_54593/m.140527 type:complete len:205 (-) Transcript_54593:96-710(-)